MKIKRWTSKWSCESKKVSDINGAQESTHTVPRDHPVVSRFAVVVQLFWLLLLRRLSAKRNALLLKMPHTTACVFMAVVRILSVLHINSDIVQLGVPDLLDGILEYNFPLKRYMYTSMTVLREWAWSVMPANRQLTMTARGTAMSRTQH